MTDLFFSVDIEADGPYPLDYSMLSFGCAVFTPEGQLISTYSANLETLPGAMQDPDTMEWWKGQPEAWEAHRQNIRPPQEVMPEFVKWVKGIRSNHIDYTKPARFVPRGKVKPVFVGYPAGFDFTFMYVYMRKFAGESPFSFSALDIKSYAMAVLGTDFRDTTKRKFPKRWFGKGRHNHVALDDAIEQGEMFCNILSDGKNAR